MSAASTDRLVPLAETSETAETAMARSAAAFGAETGDDELDRWQARLERGEIWGWQVEGRILAQCRLLDREHWFGGRRVPSLDVASVAVPSEHRGRGLGAACMRAAVTRWASQGAGLSLLFPATSGFYRRLGWEHAGHFGWSRLATRHAPAVGAPLRPADQPSDWTAIRACQERQARRAQGPEVRSDDRWEQLRSAAYHYVLDGKEPGTVEAYLLVNHRRPSDDWRYVLAIQDWAATSPRGLAALVGFVARHRSLSSAAEFRATVPERWSLLVDEQDVELTSSFYWMARGLDLGAAVAARGFPSSLAVSVTLRVEDPLAQSQPEPVRLEIAGGRGQLVPAPGADVGMDARAVGPLYTGFRSAHELALAGLLRGPDAALDLLTDAFAGTPPVLFDFF